MVKAIVNIDEKADKILKHLKAEYNLRDKSEAINLMAKEFTRFVRIEPEIRPEYVKELMKIHKGKRVKIGSVEDFKRRYGPK
jgi:DNA-directed RNA polymerase subunit F